MDPAPRLCVSSGNTNRTKIIVRHIPTWMPGAGFKRNALALRPSVDQMLSAPFEAVKRDMVGTLLPLSLHFIDRQSRRNWVPPCLPSHRTCLMGTPEVRMARSTRETNMILRARRVSCMEVCDASTSFPPLLFRSSGLVSHTGSCCRYGECMLA